MKTLADLDKVITRIQSARHILVITGAGISADSGLPTYRGISGLYNQSHTEEGLPIEVALSGEIMRKNPAITWKYLAQIETACRQAQANAAHHAIAALEKIKPTSVLTQNIDGFHTAAGSKDIIEIHGNLFTLQCTRCSYQTKVVHYADLDHIPPSCPTCQAILRPNVVLFGESLPEAALIRLDRTLHQGYDVVFSIGTSSVFPYIAYPFQQAAQIGALAIEINPVDTAVSQYADIHWRCGAADAFKLLMSALLK